MRKFITLSSLIFCSFHSFAQPGQLDPSFGNHGFVKTDIGAVYDYNNGGKQVLTGPGGSIYILFNNPVSVSKRLPDGSLDSSYGVNGYSKPSFFTDPIAVLQPDGKIVILGLDPDFDFVMCRLNPCWLT